MLKLIVLAVLLFATCSSMSVSKRSQVQLCGRRLAEALNLLCQGQYYDPDEEDISKRRLVPRLRAELNSVWFFGLSSLRNEPRQYPHHKPSSFRQQRGVVDECCKRPCSPSALLAYCSNK